MQEPDLIDLFVMPLEAAGLDSYMVSGSVAAIEYGEPRATIDVDVALMISISQVPELQRAFPEPDYYCPMADLLEIEINRPNRGHFNVIHLASGLKADFYPSRNHPFLKWAMTHRRRLKIADREIWFAPPEYVILWKLEFFREGGGDKHGRDIKGILELSEDDLDRDLLRNAIFELGLAPSWKQLYPDREF